MSTFAVTEEWLRGLQTLSLDKEVLRAKYLEELSEQERALRWGLAQIAPKTDSAISSHLDKLAALETQVRALSFCNQNTIGLGSVFVVSELRESNGHLYSEAGGTDIYFLITNAWAHPLTLRYESYPLHFTSTRACEPFVGGSKGQELPAERGAVRRVMRAF